MYKSERVVDLLLIQTSGRRPLVFVGDSHDASGGQPLERSWLPLNPWLDAMLTGRPRDWMYVSTTIAHSRVQCDRNCGSRPLHHHHRGVLCTVFHIGSPYTVKMNCKYIETTEQTTENGWTFLHAHSSRDVACKCRRDKFPKVILAVTYLTGRAYGIIYMPGLLLFSCASISITHRETRSVHTCSDVVRCNQIRQSMVCPRVCKHTHVCVSVRVLTTHTNTYVVQYLSRKNVLEVDNLTVPKIEFDNRIYANVKRATTTTTRMVFVMGANSRPGCTPRVGRGAPVRIGRAGPGTPSSNTHTHTGTQVIDLVFLFQEYKLWCNLQKKPVHTR